MNIDAIAHPDYEEQSQEWYKWRLTYSGGRPFINTYLKKFSSRETNEDFNDRRDMTYCPRFAGAAIDEVKNSIFQRFIDITRIGGTSSYKEAIVGGQYGVDLLGSTMNSFIGRRILPELLVMRKVGIYVDMPIMDFVNPTLVQNYNSKPYLYIYTAEDIKSWQFDLSGNNNQFSILLLKDCQYQYDQETGLPVNTREIYKRFWIKDNYVNVQLYEQNDEDHYVPIGPVIILNINRIPFVVAELSHSLMCDIADYQIALLNLGSSDIAYSLKSNYPFYVEQADMRSQSQYLKDNQENNEVIMGPTSGRRYPMGANAPEFINPSSDTLKASMEKQEQLKEEIRQLLNLSISNLSPGSASAESKGYDERNLESGLSYIGLELEHMETQIGQLWSMYENNKSYPVVKYPEKYNIKSDEERRKDCQSYNELLGTLPSKTYQKEIGKIMASTLLSGRISNDTLLKIKTEIDSAEVVDAHQETIASDIEQGLVGLELASKIRGYPPGEVEAAKQDHADRLARIAESQTPPGEDDPESPAARGLNILDKRNNNPDGRDEKKRSRITTTDKTVTDKVRGNGKQ